MGRLPLAIIFGVTLAACTPQQDLFRMTLVLSNANESEVFLGEAAGPPNDRGAFVIVSREGVVCEGFYLLSDPTKGEAIARCEDGRTGEFRLSSEGRVATISGTIGGEAFSGGAVDKRIVEAALAAIR